MSMLRRRIEAKRMGTQRPVAVAQKTVASRRVVAGLGIVLDNTGSEQFMDEIDRRVSFKARFAKETRERQEKLAEMRGEVATAKRKATAENREISIDTYNNFLKALKKVAKKNEWTILLDHVTGKYIAVARGKKKNAAGGGPVWAEMSAEFGAAEEAIAWAAANSIGTPIWVRNPAKKTSDSEVGQSARADKGNGTKLPIPSKSHRAGVRARADKVQGIEEGETLVGRVEISDDTYTIKAKKEGDKFYAYKDDARQSNWAKVSGFAGQPTMGLLKQALSGFYKDIEFAEGGRFKSFAAADLSVAVPEGVSPEAVEEGAAVEKEHGTTYNQIKEYYAEHGEFPPFDMVTEWIASDHLKEFADYYEALEAMEKELKAGKVEAARDVAPLTDEPQEDDHKIFEIEGGSLKAKAMSAKAEYSKATVDRVAEELGKAQGISIKDVQNVADYLKIGYTAEEIAEEYNDWPVDDIVQVIKKLEMYKDENSEVPEDNEGEPQDEDFIIIDSRGSTYEVGIQNGRHIGTAKDWDAAEQMIRDFTKNDNWAYFPTVWHINDHGNASIVTDFNYDK